MKAHQKPIGNNDEWLTPPEIIKALGSFDLDPCAPVDAPWPTAERHLTINDDGLSTEWTGRVWLNPPFNRKERPKWMEKMAAHKSGVMLIPAATETEAFYQHVWARAFAVCFMKSRLHFHFVNGSRAGFNCGTALALVVYTEAEASVLRAANLGVTINL